MVRLGEKAEFLFVAAEPVEEFLDPRGRDKDVVGGINDEHRQRDLRRGVETAADEVEEAFEEADGVGVELVRGGFNPAAMRFVARDPVRRIVLVPLGELADVNALRWSHAEEKAEDQLLPPGRFSRQRDHGGSEHQTGGEISFIGLGQKADEQRRPHAFAVIINLRAGMALADEREESAQIGKPILDPREVAAPVRAGIVPLPAQFEREGDNAVLRQMTGQRFVIERGAAESMHGDDDRARALAGGETVRP